MFSPFTSVAFAICAALLRQTLLKLCARGRQLPGSRTLPVTRQDSRLGARAALVVVPEEKATQRGGNHESAHSGSCQGVTQINDGAIRIGPQRRGRLLPGRFESLELV